jgi:hypothetical protein
VPVASALHFKVLLSLFDDRAKIQVSQVYSSVSTERITRSTATLSRDYIIIRSHDKSIVRSGDFCIHNIYATQSAYSLVVR